MIKQLRRVGNSNALILERPVMEMIGLEEDGQVELTVRAGSLIVTPANPRPVSGERLEQLLSKVIKKRRQVLKRLAE